MFVHEYTSNSQGKILDSVWYEYTFVGIYFLTWLNAF